MKKGYSPKTITPCNYWYARQDSNPPKADFGWRLNLLLGSHHAANTKKAGNGFS
jgi:hypothetical protein